MSFILVLNILKLPVWRIKRTNKAKKERHDEDKKYIFIRPFHTI